MLAQQIVNGLAIGCIYALVAIGFVLIYKATEVINFAQGEIMMVGAFFAFTCINILDLPFLPSFFITLFVIGLFGALLEFAFVKPMVGESPLSIAMLTIGLGMLIRSLAGMVWGYDTYKYEDGISDQTLRWVINEGANTGENITSPLIISISSLNLWIIFITIILIIVLYLFFNRTKLGISMVAASQNQLAAFLMGIGVKRVFTRIWAMSAIVAAVAGILLSQVWFLDYNMSFIGLKAFPAAVLGGFGSIPGAIIGGIIIGVTEAVAGIYLPPGFKEVSPWIILTIVLLIKPEGIFGIKRIKRV